MKRSDVTSKHEDVFWEMWGCFNLLRDLGFRSDDIKAVMGLNGRSDLPFLGKVCGFMELTAQGKSYTICCYPLPAGMDKDSFTSGWTKFSEELPEMNDALLTQKWEVSLAYREKVLIMRGLVDKGFRFPAHDRSH